MSRFLIASPNFAKAAPFERDTTLKNFGGFSALWGGIESAELSAACLLHDGRHKTVGWYLYYAKRGGIGEVVQTAGPLDLFKDIFGHLVEDAREQGVIALHGRADFRRLADLSDQGCFFTCRGGWTLAFTRRAEIMDILRSANVSLSRLDGEWCLDLGE